MTPRPTAESPTTEAGRALVNKPFNPRWGGWQVEDILAIEAEAAALSDSAHDEKYITRDECYRLTVEAVTAATRPTQEAEPSLDAPDRCSRYGCGHDAKDHPSTTTGRPCRVYFGTGSWHCSCDGFLEALTASSLDALTPERLAEALAPNHRVFDHGDGSWPMRQAHAILSALRAKKS